MAGIFGISSRVKLIIGVIFISMVVVYFFPEGDAAADPKEKNPAARGMVIDPDDVSDEDIGKLGKMSEKTRVKMEMTWPEAEDGTEAAPDPAEHIKKKREISRENRKRMKKQNEEDKKSKRDDVVD